ncbi:hypothetical protein JCM6882_004539 [Rhodosporidiobolus microsporus]
MTATSNGKAVKAAPPAKSTARLPHGEGKRGLLAFVERRQLELYATFLLAILGGNALTPPDYHLSTTLTPAPSFHLRSRLSRCLFLSFRQPNTDLYYKGRDDAYFIGYWVVLFLFAREALMRWVFEPFARFCGIWSRRLVVRFAEQAWLIVYYLASFSVGIYINQTSDYASLNTVEWWRGYPHDALPALTKWYYLVQTAFWIQQIITLNLEAKRKDFGQMFTHHIITMLLMSFSYVLNWTRIGNTVLCTMDLSDIFFSLAKVFKYAGNNKAADGTFVVFLISWIATRHVIFCKILYAVITEPQTVLEYGWRSQDGYFFSRNVQISFALLLGSLQLLMCLWMWLILRVLYKMFLGGSAEDVRSDDEDEGEEEDEPVKANGHSNGANGQAERKKDR